MPDKRASATRAVCIALAALLLASVCALIAPHLRPDHNTAGIALEKQDPTVRRALSPLQGLQATGDINVNTATAEELCAIKGVGAKLAEAIIAEREINGRFSYVEDLLSVKGIGRATLKELLPQIRLE